MADTFHLALICERYDPDGGGAERHLAEISHALTSRGHTVTIFAADVSSKVSSHDRTHVRVSSIGRIRSGRQLRAFRDWAMTQLNSGSFDTSLSFTTSVPGRVVNPRGGTVCETLHQNLASYSDPKVRAIRRMTQWLNFKRRAQLHLEARTFADSSVRYVVANSQYVMYQLKRHYEMEKAKIRLLPNAVSLTPPDPQKYAELRIACREQLGIEDHQTAYLFSAYNPRLKGIYPLLDAWSDCIREGLDGVLIVTGRITRAMRRQASGLNLDQSIRWVGPVNNMIEYYSAADVTIHPTFYDPASRVVIESLLMGVPAITTGFNGAADLLIRPDSQQRGRVVCGPNDKSGLGQAILELSDPDERQRCIAAMAGIEQETSFDRYVENLEQILIESRG